MKHKTNKRDRILCLLLALLLMFGCLHWPASAVYAENETVISATPEPTEVPETAEEADETEQPEGDRMADLEDADTWARMIEDLALENCGRKDLLCLAASQIGYTQSVGNYIYDAQGQRKSYSRYGAWADDAYGEWNNHFVRFCLHYAGVPGDAVPFGEDFYKNPNKWIEQMREHQMLTYATELGEDYVPRPGDLVLICNNEGEPTGQLGILTLRELDENGSVLHEMAVLGDIDGKVQELDFAETPASETLPGGILAYIPLPEQPKDAPELTQMPEPMTETEVMEEPAAPEMPAFEGCLTVDGIIVTVKAEKGVFPADARLSVEKVGAAEQPDVDAAVESGRADGQNVVVSYSFDIKILNGNNEVIQPTDGKKVKVSFALAEVANGNLETQIYHLKEEDDGKLSAQALEVETEGEEATVETDGFSFYTVEFTYEDKEYVIPGGSELLLSDLLEQLELSGQAESWEVSNPELFDIFLGDEVGILYEYTEIDSVPTNGGTIPWLLSLQPFHTTEWLKVVIDGVEYEIVVTDDDTTNTVPSSYTGTVATNVDGTHAVTGDTYYVNATKPTNVRQSQSTTSCTDFAAGLPLSTIFIDTSKIGGSGTGQSAEGIYTVLTEDPKILAGLVRNGNRVSYDPTKTNTYPADPGVLTVLAGDLFCFVFPDAAILQDGSRADLKITYSNAKIAVDQRLGVINSTYQGEIGLVNGASFNYSGTDARNLNGADYTPAQRTAMQNAVRNTVALYDSTQTFNNSAIRTPFLGHTMDATYQVVDKNGNPVNGTFIFAMAGVNLDRDPYRKSGNNVCKPLWYYNNAIAGGQHLHFFSEAVSINSGMLSDYIYVRPNSSIEEPHASTGTTDKAHYYPEVILDENGNVKFIGNAYQGDGLNLSANDNTYSSGFVLMGDASGGLKITATGHGNVEYGMNTQLFSAKQIWYRYTHSTGPNGNIQTTSEGNHGGTLSDTGDNGASKILDPNTYVVAEGKTVTYTMTPNKHYQIAKFQVKNVNGNWREIKYNGKPLSTMRPGQKVTFRDAAGQLCTLTAMEDGKFKVELPYALHDEAVHVEWQRTVSEVTVRKETVDNKPGKFRFKIKAHKNEDVTEYEPERLGSIFIDPDSGAYVIEFGSGATCEMNADDLAALMNSVTLSERIEISGGSYLWKTNVKLSDLGISYGGDDSLFVDFLNAASAALDDPLGKALNLGYGGVPERIYFYKPNTHVENITIYWNFPEEEGQENDPGWHYFELNNGEEIKYTIESRYWYEVHEETPTGWELVSIDGAVGAGFAASYLSEGTVTTPIHTFRNRKLPSLTVSKETIKNAPGEFTFTLRFVSPAVSAQSYTMTGTAAIREGVLTYSFKNAGAAFAINGIVVPTGTFFHGRSAGLDAICDRLLDLSAGSSDDDMQITLGQEDGTVSTSATQSLQAWVESMREDDGSYSGDGEYTVTYTFQSPSREEQPYVLPALPAGATYDSETGLYTFTVANGESLTFPYMPVGVTYEVVEAGADGWELVTSENTSGTLTVGNDVTAVFTNQRFLDLTVTKNVSGNQASRDKFFKITVEITGAEPNAQYAVDLTRAVAVSGSNRATIAANAGQTNPTTVTADSSGEITASFYLQHGQSITIKDLHYGVGYTVTETSEDYRPSLVIVGDTKTGDADGETGTDIATGDDVATATDSYLVDDTTLTFTNRRIGIVPTGVNTSVSNGLPLIIALLAGGLLLMYCGRRKRSHA